jgi:hypothetical protein
MYKKCRQVSAVYVTRKTLCKTNNKQTPNIGPYVARQVRAKIAFSKWPKITELAYLMADHAGTGPRWSNLGWQGRPRRF